MSGINRSTHEAWKAGRYEAKPLDRAMLEVAFEHLKNGDHAALADLVVVDADLHGRYGGILLVRDSCRYLRPRPRWLPRWAWRWLCRVVTVEECPQLRDGVLYRGNPETRAAIPVDENRRGT